MVENPENDKSPEEAAPSDQDLGKVEKDPTKFHLEKNPAALISGTWLFLKSILSLRDGKYDIKGVLENVRDGIVFSGYNVWILGCSIIVASVGLNMDSTAVIIGAMLISPLMGPIRGIGFGVGINDFKLLTDSLKNFGITVGISLLVSFLYFLVTPIHDLTDNIFARTEPSFLDVVIAFFGGLAGVVAQSQKKADTVIPGVAIATALMPPLCVAGYGLANGEWSFFFGAIYLFILNSILIAASTYFFIRYLRFPKKEYVNPRTEKKVRGYTIGFIIVVVAPSIYMFYRITQISIFESNAESFIEEVVKDVDPNISVNPTYEFDWSEPVIHLEITNFYADKFVQEMWKRQLDSYGLEDAHLDIKQGQDLDTKMDQKFEEWSRSNQGANTLAQLLSKNDNEYAQLMQEYERLQKDPKLQPDPLELDDLLAGFKIDYPEYSFISVDRSFTLNNKNKLDTTYMVKVIFKEEIEEDQRKQLNAKLSKRVKLELKQKANIKQDSVRVLTLLKEEL